MASFGDVHVFGHNSAESEPIWMKSGTLWGHCWGLALADIGHDPQSSVSWRARWNFVFCQVSNAQFHRFFMKFEHNMSIGVATKTFRTEFW